MSVLVVTAILISSQQKCVSYSNVLWFSPTDKEKRTLKIRSQYFKQAACVSNAKNR